MTKLIKKHSVLSYFILVLFIAFSSIALFSLFTGIPASTADREKWFPLAVIIVLISPLFSGVILTLIIDGPGGLKKYFGQFLAFKRSPGWYALVFFFAPVLVFSTLIVLMQFSAEYTPAIFTSENLLMTIILGLAAGFLGGGLAEEFGWTGFALPKLREKYGSLVSAILIAIVWGIWHLPVTLYACGDVNGAFLPDEFYPTVVFYMLVLPVYRILMVFMYDYTRSLPLMMIMHSVLSATTVFILNPGAKGNALSLYYVILAAILAFIVVICYVVIRAKDRQRLLPYKT